METTLIVIQFILVVVITISVLLQKSSSLGLGAYSGSNESVFGAKGPAGFLAKFTFVLGILFIANTLSLGYLYNKISNQSVLDNTQMIIPSTPNKTKQEIPAAPSIPQAPKTQN